MGQNELENLMLCVARKDRDAFRALYEATSAKLFAIAVRIVKRTDLAEEVLQDSYLKVWNQAQDYSASVNSPMSWMAVIVRNRAIDVLRKKTESTLSDMQEDIGLAGETPDPFAVAEQSAELRALLACMDPLDPEHRRCFLLAYYYGYTHDQIAELVSAPVGTVKSRIRRAMARIRECMSHDG